MKALFRRILFAPFLLFSLCAWSETIFTSNLDKAALDGATVTASSCSLSDSPSWATGYTKAYKTTGSGGYATITFSPAIDFSDYNNVQLTVHWGSDNNRPLKVSINGGTAAEIHASLTEAERSKIVDASCALSVSSLSSIKLLSSGGGNVCFFDVTITGTYAPPTNTIYLKPGAWEIGGERYAVYCFGAGEKWYDMESIDGGCDVGTIYKADVHAKYPNCIFCRMNGGTTENKWDNKWNQTVDLKVADGPFCTIIAAGGGDLRATSTWNHTPYKVCISGNLLSHAGTHIAFTEEPLVLTATCVGATHFQWYKGGTAESNKISGATNATYKKDACSFDNEPGVYYCKAGTGGSEVTSNAYEVKMLRMYFNVGRNGTDYGSIDLRNTDPDHKKAAGMIFLGEDYSYAFSVTDGFGHYYGQNNDPTTGAMWSGNCTNWPMNSNQQCCIRTQNGATYTFIVDYTNMSLPYVSALYPPDHQEADYMIYFDNSVLNWTNLHYRIGRTTTTTKEQIYKVPGTANLYQYKTKDYPNLNAWHIANNCGHSGSGYSIYKTKTGDAYAITKSIRYEGGATTRDITITPKDKHSTGDDIGINDNCEFYQYTTIPGMKTQNVMIDDTENGTITVEYIDADGNVPPTFTSGNRDLAHTCILTITATPDCGYQLETLKVNGADFTNKGTHILDATATIEATFTIKEGAHTITYHLNGGTINEIGYPTTYTLGIGAILPMDVTLVGKDFKGWYDNPGLTGTPVTEISVTECGDKEYWAKWVLGKPSPVFTWDYETTIKAGGIYPISVATTGDADVTLSIVETIAGVDGTFTAGNPASGTVTIGSYPAASSFTYHASSPETADFKAKTEDKTITIERCEKADIVSYAVDPVNAGGDAKPRYYCEASGVGRIMKGTGNSSISTSSGTFTGESWATKYLSASEHSIQVYQEDVFKIVFYVKSTSNTTTINDLRYSDEYKESSGDWTDIKSSAQIIYNDNPSATSLTKNALETLTIIPSSPMSKNGWLYFKLTSSTQVWGVKLYRAEGDEPTSIAFSGEPEVEKYPGDVAFTKAAIQTTTPILSGGRITYKSSDETVATVDANTGEVTPLNTGHANITATLSAFGCFKAASASYSLTVRKCADPVCTIAVTAGKANKCSTDNVTLTATAAAGAAIQWYKDGVAIAGATNPTLTTQEAGEYYAEARKACLQVSDPITVTNFAYPTATALHEYYYIRAGRTTPDIALFQLTNVDVTDPDNAFEMNRPAPTGCAYELREDGIVYLTGTPDASLTVDDYEIKVTAKNPCSSKTASAQMHIHQITQGKIAWVGCGDKGGADPTENAIPASQGTNHVLYKYLKDYFELVPVNAYWTIDKNQIRDYYSQFDLVLLTDYPDTNTKPEGESGGKEKSYSNALGCLIDQIPILTFEAFVADCPDWGINSNPKTPKPEQKDMTLLCSAHKIFEHTTITNEVVEFLSTTSGAGNALQGFIGLEAPAGMIFIATIADPDETGGNLIVCCERQKVIEARMMIMGLNHDAMGKVSEDGKIIIKQIIEYLLQFTDISDCSIVFDNGAGNADFNPGTYTGTGTKGDGLWSTAANWYPTYNAVPNAEQAVRVDKPCNVDIENAHCSSIRLRKDGTWDGKLTIMPHGALTVMDGITEVHGTNFMTTYPSAAADLVIKAGDQSGEYGCNGSLVFGNTEDDLQATVEYYSLAKDAKTTSPVWQYIGIPITDRPMAIDAYHAAWMCSWESEGNVSSNWVWVENEDRIQPFKGYCITQQEAKKYTYIGSLSKPEAKDLHLYYFTSEDGDGFNMFANSWVAPIDITKMETEDFGGAAEPTIFIYNTGTRKQYEDAGSPSTEGTYTGAGQFNAIPVKAASYLEGSLTKIPTMQGFFIQASKEGTMTLDYKKLCFNTETYSTTAEIMRAPKRTGEEPAEEPVTEKIVPEVMRIDVVSANWGDRLYILMHPEFSDAFDRGWDGSKQEGDAAAPMLALVRENGLLAVAAIPSAEERELSFRAGSDTEYTFGFQYEGETIYLYDRLTGEATEIKTGNTYSFTAENKTPAKRFLITTHPEQTPTSVSLVETGDNLHFENYGKELVTVRIVDMQGRVLYTTKTTDEIVHICPSLPYGVYLAHITMGNETRVVRMIGKEDAP